MLTITDLQDDKIKETNKQIKQIRGIKVSKYILKEFFLVKQQDYCITKDNEGEE